MGVRYEWADDDHIIMNMVLEAPWTWEQFHQGGSEVYAVLGQLEHPCATVIDVSKMGNLPPGNVLAHLQQIERIMPENLFMSLLVGAPYIATVFMNLFMKIRPQTRVEVRFMNTQQEAHALVRQRYQERQSLSGKHPG